MTDSCGTYSGYVLHRRVLEAPCEACQEAQRDYKRAWRERTRETRAEYARVYREENPEVINAASRRYRERHPERRAASVARYNEANPEVRRGTVRTRRARRAGGEVERYSEAQVLDHYGVDCHICSEPIDLTAPRRSGEPGWERGLHIDHLIPICDGGSDTLLNVRPSHGLCNCRKNRFDKDNNKHNGSADNLQAMSHKKNVAKGNQHRKKS